MQRQVLHFYRRVLREARHKDSKQSLLLHQHARNEFERSVSRTSPEDEQASQRSSLGGDSAVYYACLNKDCCLKENGLTSSLSELAAGMIAHPASRYRGVDRKNYQLIEHLLRKGGKQLQVLKDSEIATLRSQ